MASATLTSAGQLQETAAKLAAAAQDSGVVEGLDGYFFLREELEHLAAGKFWGEAAPAASKTGNDKIADPVPALVSYSKELGKRGVDLYLMVVPPKALIYPDKLDAGLSPKASVEAAALYRSFYDELENKGVKTLDLIPEMLEARDKEDLYCLTDTHFSGAGLALFAEKAAAIIKAEDWYEKEEKKQLQSQQKTVSITGDLLTMMGKDGPQEELELLFITNAEGAALDSDIASPVVLLGDSHTLVFSAGGDLHARGAGLFDRLSGELGFAVDLLGVRGSGVTPARIKFYQRSKKDPDYLTSKKIVIWCFTAREITGSGGWKKIPPAPPAAK